MEVSNLGEMFKGWFIGDFVPTLYNTNVVEVAVKKYLAGDFENAHYHKIATEFTIVISGEIEMNGVKYGPDSIIKVYPEESVEFKSLTDSVNVVVKIPGALNDKYLVQ